MDRIEITGLRVFGRHGVFDWEQEQGQDFTVDVALDVDLRAAGASDELADTVDYGLLAERIAREVEDTQFQLLEALAQHLSDVVLSDERVRAVDIRIGKPDVALSVELHDVAVHVRRSREAG
ncbi:MAG TPA: dihydroneopterin aldolase [Egibacteraceae bacterium]|nr:dihydroneopterin aldolase [Egibacteraceae bacterium]